MLLDLPKSIEDIFFICQEQYWYYSKGDSIFSEKYFFIDFSARESKEEKRIYGYVRKEDGQIGMWGKK